MATQFPPKSCQQSKKKRKRGAREERKKTCLKRCAYTHAHTHTQGHTDTHTLSAAPPLCLHSGASNRTPSRPPCCPLPLPRLQFLAVAIAALSDCANDMHATCSVCNVQRATHTHTDTHKMVEQAAANGKWRNGRNSNKQSAPATPPPSLLHPFLYPSPPSLPATLPHLAEVAYAFPLRCLCCSIHRLPTPSQFPCCPSPPRLLLPGLWQRAAAAPAVDAYMSEMLACPCCISALISFIAKVLDVN